MVGAARDLRGELDAVLLRCDGRVDLDGELPAVPYLSGTALRYYRGYLVDTTPTGRPELMEVGLRAGEQEGSHCAGAHARGAGQRPIPAWLRHDDGGGAQRVATGNAVSMRNGS